MVWDKALDIQCFLGSWCWQRFLQKHRGENSLRSRDQEQAKGWDVHREKCKRSTQVINGSRSNIANPFMAKIQNLVESYCGKNGLELVNTFDVCMYVYMYRPTR